MKRKLQSVILAVALMFGATATVTIGHSLVVPTAAEAGVLGKIGGAIKKTANGIGKAAKAGAKGTIYVGKTVGKGVGGTVKRAAIKVGKVAAKTPIVKGIRNAGRAVRNKF